ncbi:Glucose-1-phosphate adenylyltransferase [Posidoniimonas polymericola]|uniref:Glucose-1-phosphate adenylyltransferase n=1 Tax=Posidoniimonas polymericola TaxID=2528002 RepID=A0A5C5YI78_9BACT|nr:glucose-1-phosphate adenylyltransferase [Posidoniimonas polymericola]TWT74571.1 Glucose-1-phosphate adenylyltransferase [Posidoniimonas polymericola]
MKNVVAVVLGGGRGTRLQPLTTYRSKPAVPLAAKYRLIDIPISNCLNAGLNHVFVLTQFMTASLHQHIRGTYRFDAFGGGFVEILAAQQTMDADATLDWYQGTADAVRKNLRYLLQPGFDYVLILSGDQLYRMDFAKMLAEHQASGADVSIAGKPVERSEASALGIMRLDDTGRVIGFVEKPKTAEQLDQVRMDPAWIDARGVESHGRDCLASMGIYLWNRDAMVEALEQSNSSDFGKEIFPNAIKQRHVQVSLFDGYWEDIGTIRSFYECNLAMARADSPFSLADASAPIYTRARFLPPTRCDGAEITQSLIAEGCVIEPGAKIENSVIGLRCRIGKNAVIKDSILMGADMYETPSQLAALPPGEPPLGVGDGTLIQGAIVDKNCRIAPGLKVVNDTGQEDYGEGRNCVVRDGILVVPKNCTLGPDWHL